MINPRDAHTLRRLLVGHTLNGELEALTGSFNADFRGGKPTDISRVAGRHRLGHR